MAIILLGAAGLMLVMGLTAVYSAFLLAHRTDVIVARLNDDLTRR